MNKTPPKKAQPLSPIACGLATFAEFPAAHITAFSLPTVFFRSLFAPKKSMAEAIP